MRLLSALYRRFSRLIHEVAKFGTVGAFAYVVQLAATNLFWYGLGTAELAGQVLGTTCATVVAFLGNRFWTFRDRSHSGLVRAYALFFGLNAVGLLIQLVCLWFTVSVLGLDGPLARNIAGNVVGVGLGSLFRFWSYRKWVFRAPSAGAGPPGTGPDTVEGGPSGTVRSS
ncbi:GtrA family protein [Actinorugispora endophytica]|uniref:Putative flippase GtrA n=1 Tax=Actinorugispora endophytica TaxID=1605990 RepID=A0A4R6UXE4_9ACTN|nr:GtrA family protein [Actinorugispora endophytica]TDQ51901.1 putative flippase GtrA [Actinorugispora endophytica]